LENQIVLKYFGSIKTKGLNRIAKIGYGHICPMEEYLSFNNISIIYYVTTVDIDKKII